MKKPLNLVDPKGLSQGNTKPSPRNREGLETIPKGSTAKRLEKGATRTGKAEGNDIVRAASKGADVACNKCGIRRPITDFYPRNKVCKECTKKRVASYQKTDRGREVHRLANHKWSNTGNRGSLSSSKYNKSEKGRFRRMRHYQSMLSTPDGYAKLRGQWVVGNLIRSEKLVRPDRCELCGEEKKLDGHHQDYSKPDEVIWLCRACHGDWHRSSDLC